MTLILRREKLDSATASALIGALNRELSAQYPEPGVTHFNLDEEEVSPGRGIFLVARLNGVPLGCGAVRRRDPESAELKRMYVAPEARGKGVGRALLEALEAEGRRLGVGRLVLETGIRQDAAIRLYRAAGYVTIPTLPEYQGSPVSHCMAKEL